MQNYKELVVCQKSHELAVSTYKCLSNFPRDETFNIVSQIKRAVTSIPANIAEGSGKYTQKDFASYLQNALGSTHEVEYFFILSKDLNFINTESYDNQLKLVNEIKAMLISLLKKVRT